MRAGLQLLAVIFRNGCRVQLREGTVAVEGNRAALPAELVRQLRDRKLEIRAALLEPRRSALELWEGALREVATRWAACNAGKAEGPRARPASDELLQLEVGDAIRAGDLPRAVAAIDCWRTDWLGFLGQDPANNDRVVGGAVEGYKEATCDPSPGWVEIESDVLGERVVILLRPDAAEAARAACPHLVIYSGAEVDHLYKVKDRTALIKAVHLAKRALGGSVLDPRLAVAVDSSPEKPKGATRFDVNRQRFSGGDASGRSLTSWLKVNAHEVFALWPDAPAAASWREWRGKVCSAQVPLLDEGFSQVMTSIG